ncbi:hypothetical protein [Streptomyces sp. NPDC058326]|uniref:hypothetical protein n=1 Tax=Streptomyces sp. NPDC058326 TaxID=3346447 RepID=UPI0036EEC72C
MRTPGRIAGAIATVAITGGGMLAAAPSASAGEQLYGCTSSYITGSGGHKGAAITCKGADWESFVGWVKCRNVDGHIYESYGPKTWANNASTAWCALGYRVYATYYYAV